MKTFKGSGRFYKKILMKCIKNVGGPSLVKVNPLNYFNALFCSSTPLILKKFFVSYPLCIVKN